eukprot:73245-Pelagomonas_calceolata.AAC.1
MNELWLERMGIPLMAMNLGYVVLLKYVLIAFSCRDFMVPATFPQARMKDAQRHVVMQFSRCGKDFKITCML